MNLGDRVKLKRQELGLSQEELAHRMGYKERFSISKIECGRPVKQDTVVRLANVLCVTPSYLMGWEDDSGNEILSDIPDSFVSSVGKRIRLVREERGMSISDLANKTGISNAKLIEMEEGIDRGFDVPLMYKFATVLTVAPCYFLQGEMLPEVSVVENIKMLCDINFIDPSVLANEFGISKKDISSYINGSVPVPFSVIEKVCSYFNVSYTFFFCNDLRIINKDDTLRVEARLKFIAKKWVADFRNYDLTSTELQEIINYAKFLISKRSI